MRRALLWIGITVVLLFVIFLVIGIFVSNDTDEESTGGSEPTESAASTPTLRPAPSTPPPSPTQRPMETPEPTAAPTPTFEESLQGLTVCERVMAKLSMGWGQAPGVIYSNDARVTGRIEQGDYVQFLTPPDGEGRVRVQVYPHDGRTVGQSEGKVWIDWGSLEQFRLDLDMFSCEN